MILQRPAIGQPPKRGCARIVAWQDRSWHTALCETSKIPLLIFLESRQDGEKNVLPISGSNSSSVRNIQSDDLPLSIRNARALSQSLQPLPLDKRIILPRRYFFDRGNIYLASKAASRHVQILKILHLAMNNSVHPLTSQDRAILRALQSNARIKNAELAEKIGMSATACWNRTRHLEEIGLISGYVALSTRPSSVWQTLFLSR